MAILSSAQVAIRVPAIARMLRFWRRGEAGERVNAAFAGWTPLRPCFLVMRYPRIVDTRGLPRGKALFHSIVIALVVGTSAVIRIAVVDANNHKVLRLVITQQAATARSLLALLSLTHGVAAASKVIHYVAVTVTGSGALTKERTIALHHRGSNPKASSFV
jgi:hypothetical protein